MLLARSKCVQKLGPRLRGDDGGVRRDDSGDFHVAGLRSPAAARICASFPISTGLTR